MPLDDALLRVSAISSFVGLGLGGSAFLALAFCFGFGSATNGAGVYSQRMLPSACLRWIRLVRPASTSVALARLARLAKRSTNLPLSLVDCSTHTARATFGIRPEPPLK